MAQSHYVSSSAIHVNGTTSPAEGYVFQVNGKTKLSDALSATTISASGDITTSGAITATGNIQGNYIQGTWLYTSAATELEMSQVTKIALIHTNNYIYYIAPASLKVGGASLADVATNALAADKLNTSKGDKNTPVYFSNGIPKACTGLDLDTSGNAATATALRSPKDKATLSYLDYTDSTQTCDYFAVWDNTTYSGKPTVRAMNASYMRSNLDVPSRSGVGASGDWGINITGNAATVTTRTLTIGDTGKNYNGSAAVSWSASEIGYRHEWTATVKGATWSRLCKVVYGTNVIGSKYILNIGATRGNVVYNDTFIITAHHSQSGKIIKIAGNNYTSGYQIRLVVNSAGDSYVELYDNANSLTSASTQTVYCRLIPIFCGTITKYTAFTSGATLPSGYIVKQTMTTTTQDIQGIISEAARVTNALSINGKSYNGSVAINVGTLSSAYGGTGVTSHTANRLVWSTAANTIQATNNHYANASKIAINYTTEPTQNFYVSGTSHFTGNITTGGNIQSSAAESTIKTSIANGTNVVGLYSSSNRGLYDFTLSHWMIYTRVSDNTTRIPEHLYIDNGNITSSTTMYLNSAASTSIIFKHGDTEYARINPSGCLNIGSTQASGDYKLWVQGTSVQQHIYPRVTGTYTLGAETLGWNGIYANNLYVRDNTNKYTGGRFYTTSSTSTNATESYLTIGNDTASGTAGNRYGICRIYNEGTTYINLRAYRYATNSTSTAATSRTVYLRDHGATAYLAATTTRDAVGSKTLPVYVTSSGVITACTASSVFSSLGWTAGTTAGPTLGVTVAGQNRTAVIPSASASASGVVTTGAQTFVGNKTFQNNVLIFRNTTATPAKGTILNCIQGQYQNAAGNYYTIGLVDLVASAETSTTVSSGYARFGSSNGASFFTAGESGRAMPKALADAGTLGAENTYITADSSIEMYAGCANDASKYTKAITVSSSKVTSHVALYGAVWNDYAEYRNQKEEIKPGYCVASNNNGQVYKTTEKFQACDGIVSDTFGFAIGETDECKTPLAVAGRVLAYCEGDRYSYHAGDTVCAGPGGKIIKMTRDEIREYPDRIVGIVSEIPEYETWGSGNAIVDGRIWIKVR